MCGIAGVLEYREGHTVPGHLLEAMGKVIEHRGPDQGGIYQDGPVGLVARRLKIIDLSPAGSQPIANEDGSIQLVYNGEMFNHEALRRELEVLGHKFRGRCDSEVVVHAYEAWGPRCVERFRGFFAFGLWDGPRRQLVLARDRIGIKPLYYVERPDRLVFGSEIKAILEHADVPRAMDLQSAYHYLGYEFVPGPATMFQGITKLPPGSILVARDGRLEVQPYWELRFFDTALDPEALERRVRDACRDAVHAWMMSDVPEGVFLSGGLDSTAVLAFAREATSGPLPTFTIGYADPSFSEWEYAREAARYYGTEHREITIAPITPAVIEEAVWHLDEPMTDLSALPLFLLCQEARRDVTVCLSGEGGDEVFVGYDRFVASKAEPLYRLLPRPLRRGIIEPLVTRLPDQEQKKGPLVVLRRFIEGARLDPEGGHMRWQYFGSPELDARLFRETVLRSVDRDRFAPIRRARERCNSPRRLDREIFVDTRFTMPDSVLMKVDKMSMAHALEVRVPLLDHHLVELAATIPPRLKFPGFRTRAIYRKALRGVLPPRILTRGKQGYSLPLKQWLRQELRDYTIRLLNGSEVIRAYFDRDGVNWMMAEHLARRANHNHTLWALVNLALWHRRFIEGV
ncbi:MAG TPA: asparagine synthase (glutamine-hydrolyzing) [Methylomirabilota bacterium]|nr:asparagine synthase (glutamine-hydrolyzing) [Methylomirabilota bacterium]